MLFRSEEIKLLLQLGRRGGFGVGHGVAELKQPARSQLLIKRAQSLEHKRTTPSFNASHYLAGPTEKADGDWQVQTAVRFTQEMRRMKQDNQQNVSRTMTAAQR